MWGRDVGYFSCGNFGSMYIPRVINFFSTPKHDINMSNMTKVRFFVAYNIC